ncbi:hypothetical protein BJY24_005159 [Nocardia transvalensis]|uniref:Uncharacterized protein n=1 Tax=Nocardia transvalensis TaxID=37333 RepID=A0A7W9UKF2_9NOCA|nr:hypothetical protein [Nocardia transvalensis]MBB5916247.1 hypothetical protein [Nocardia transvalensis]
MKANADHDVRERRSYTPEFPVTVGLVLLIPALASVGPVSAALLIRHRNAEAVASSALLAGTVATCVVLVVAALVAFLAAWRQARLPEPARVGATGGGRRANHRRSP